MQSMPSSFAVKSWLDKADIKPIIEQPAIFQQSERKSAVRSRQELISTYKIEKDSTGNVKSVIYSNDNQPTFEELLSLFGEQAVSAVDTETSEEAYINKLGDSLSEKYALDKTKIQDAVNLHGDAYTLNQEFHGLELTKEKSAITDETEDKIAKLIAGGFSNSQASAAVISCSLLGLDIETVLAAKKVELETEKTANSENEDIHIQTSSPNAALARKLGLPVSVLDEYKKTHTIEETALEKQYAEKLVELFPIKETAAATAERAAADDSYAPEEIVGQPFTYESNSDVNVTLNSGEYSYTETDLSIPGVNGLGLELKRQFNSAMSSTGTPYGRYDFEVMFRDIFCINYRAYEYMQLIDGEFQSIRLQERYDWEDYSQLSVSFALQDRWYSTDQYNDAVIDLLSSPSATAMAIAPDGVQVFVMLCPVLDATSPFFEMACQNRVRDYSYTVDEYGLGVGWRFNLPSIEKYRARSFSGDYDIIGDDATYERRLILPDGTRYKIDFEGDEYSNLSGYTLEDMRMRDSGRGYAGASYTLEYQNGTSYHFAKDGKILAIVDAYGNKITFDYPSQDDTEFTITDTVGNKICYTNVSPSSDQQYDGKLSSSWKYNVAYELSLNGEVVRSYYAYDDPTEDTQYLKFVVDAAGEVIQYDIATIDLEFNSFVDNRETYTNNESIRWAYLSKVTNPDGSVIYFRTTNNDRSIGICGFQTYPCIHYYENQTDVDSSIGRQTISRREYSIDDYTNIRTRGMTANYSSGVYDYYCRRIDGKVYRLEKTDTTYLFSPDHDLKKETLECYDSLQYDTLSSEADVLDWQDRNDRYVQKVTDYTYNDDHLPIYIDIKTFNEQQKSAPLQSYEYDYNEYGQILSQLAPNGQLTQYDYDDRYGQTTRVRYQQDANKTVIVRNTLTSDGKKVSQSTTSVDGLTQAKTAYGYDAYGNLTVERKYTTESDYDETQYTYAKNAWVSESKTLNVKNADGTAANGTPGYNAGVIATKITYNDRGWPVTKTDGNGNTTTMEYDAIGRVTKLTAADGASTKYDYNTSAAQVTVTDPLGAVTRNTYDPYGNLIEVYDVSASTALSTNTYWDNQLVKSIIHSSYGKDQAQYYRYDTLGRNIETVKQDENGRTLYCETLEYDDGALTQTKTISGDDNAAAQKEVSYFDEMGQVASTRYYFEDDWEENTYLYDYVGNVVKEDLSYSKDGGISDCNTYTYDVFGNVLTATDSLNNMVKSTYDFSGNQLSVQDAKGNVTKYTYDAMNRRTKVEQPFDATGTAITTYQYDGAGNILHQENSQNVSGAAEENRIVEYEYDKKNQVITAAMFAPEPNYTQYYYDAAGNLLRTYTGLTAKLTINGLDSVSGSDNDYAVTKYLYDKRSRMIQMTDALGQTESYIYDKNGQVVKKTDRNGNSTSYTYNELGQPTQTQVTDSDGNVLDTLTYSYTKTGAVKTQSNGDHTTEYYYDAFGHVIEENTDGQTVYNVYDPMGNRTDFSLFRGTTEISSIRYDYNSNGWMTSMSGNGTSATYAYDGNGNRTSTTYGNGNAVSYVYNAANYPTLVVNRNGSNTISSFTYTYALDGNVIAKTDHTGKVTEYTYDGMNRLTEEVQKKNGALVQAYAYTFDNFNNRSTLTATGTDVYTVAYSYDKNNRLVEDTKTSTDKTAKTQYFYDPNGNQIGRSMETLANSQDAESISATTTVASYEKSWYNGFNQMVRTKADDVEATYSYAPSGLRLSKTIGGTTIDYALDGNFVAAELNGDTVTARYNRGLELVGSTIGNTTSYYLYNAHGDVVNLTNTSGAATKSYEYDAFGNEVNPSADDTNPFRYCGEYFDEETGRIYLRARYYDPVLGRMLIEDPYWSSITCIRSNLGTVDEKIVLQNGNLYLYCLNNPYLFIDPNGERVLPFWGFIHTAVQLDIKKRNPDFYLEERIDVDGAIFPKRADIISPNGLVWEVKSYRQVGTLEKPAARKELATPEYPATIETLANAHSQIDMYVKNTWHRFPNVKLNLGGDVLFGKFNIYTRYVNYFVTYESIGHGIVSYRYTYQFVREQVLEDIGEVIKIGGEAAVMIMSGGIAGGLFA